MSDGVDPATLGAPAGSEAVHLLDGLTPEGRLAAYEASRLDRQVLAVWAARYPEEIPTVNGELPWIAVNAE